MGACIGAVRPALRRQVAARRLLVQMRLGLGTALSVVAGCCAVPATATESRHKVPPRPRVWESGGRVQGRRGQVEGLWQSLVGRIRKREREISRWHGKGKGKAADADEAAGFALLG